MPFPLAIALKMNIRDKESDKGLLDVMLYLQLGQDNSSSNMMVLQSPYSKVSDFKSFFGNFKYRELKEKDSKSDRPLTTLLIEDFSSTFIEKLAKAIKNRVETASKMFNIKSLIQLENDNHFIAPQLSPPIRQYSIKEKRFFQLLELYFLSRIEDCQSRLRPTLIEYQRLSILDKIETTDFKLNGGGKQLCLSSEKRVPAPLDKVYTEIFSLSFRDNDCLKKYETIYQSIQSHLTPPSPKWKFFSTSTSLPKETIEFYQEILKDLEKILFDSTPGVQDVIVSKTFLPRVCCEIIQDYHIGFRLG